MAHNRLAQLLQTWTDTLRVAPELVLTTMLVCGLAGFCIAFEKGLRHWPWMIAACITGPVALACLVMIRRAAGHDPTQGMEREAYLMCDSCGEIVRRSPGLCSQCFRPLTP